MPLRQDDNYRGPRAIHVRSHRKLGKHRTLIRPALPLANWLVDNPDVTKVTFGKILGAYGTAVFTPRVEIKPNRGGFKAVLVARNCAQTIEVTIRDQDEVENISSEVESRWPMLQAANDY